MSDIRRKNLEEIEDESEEYSEEEYSEDEQTDESDEEDSAELDYGDNITPSGVDVDDGPEIGSEEVALSRDYISSASAKAFKMAINQAPLSMGCKRAFLNVIDANFNKDVFLAYITNPNVAKLNLKLALSHVSLSSLPHDVEQPEFLQLKTNILESFPFIISRGIGGRERYYQGLHRSESRAGETIDQFVPEANKNKSETKKGWMSLLRR